jgi:hypothetical protein
VTDAPARLATLVRIDDSGTVDDGVISVRYAVKDPRRFDLIPPRTLGDVDRRRRICDSQQLSGQGWVGVLASGSAAIAM